LGLYKVQDVCEKIQNLGMMRTEDGERELSDEAECLEKITALLPDLKSNYKEAKVWLEEFFSETDK